MARTRTATLIAIAAGTLLFGLPARASQPVAAAAATPKSAPQGAVGQNITVTGAGFVAGSKVQFPADSGIRVERTVATTTRVEGTVVTAPTALTVNIDIAMDAPTGPVEFIVRNPDGGTAVCEKCFTITDGPTITAAQPDSAPQGASQNVTISGSFANGSATVRFSGGGIAVTSVTPAANGTLMANISVGSTASPTARTITVIASDGGRGVCTDCFTVTGLPLTVSTARPSSRGQGATSQSIMIIGKRFPKEDLSAAFSGAGIAVTDLTRTSSTVLTAIVDVDPAAPPGARDITVTGGTETATCAGCFTVNAGPVTGRIAPAEGQQGARNASFNLTGANYATGARVAITLPGNPDSNGVSIGRVAYAAPTLIQLTMNISTAAAEGARDVTVTNTDGGASMCAQCFTVTAKPSIAAINTNTVLVQATVPSKLSAGAVQQNVSIVGAGFVQGAKVSFSDPKIRVERTAYASPTLLTATVDVDPAATPSSTTQPVVTVTNPDKTRGQCATCFSIAPAPMVEGAQPASLTQGASNENVLISGSFAGVITVKFSGTGIKVNQVTPGNGTAIANISISPTAATTNRTITITTSEGARGTCTPACFEVLPAPPTITTIYPNSAGQGATGRQTLVSGSGYVTGATVSMGDGITITRIAYLSAGSIRVTYDIAKDATIGLRDVTVTNPGTGGQSVTKPAGFTVNLGPTIGALAPPQSMQGSTNVDLALSGAGFVPGTRAWFSGTGVKVNRVTYASPTLIMLNVSISETAAATARDLTVINPDGGSDTRTGAFTVVATPY